MKEDRNRQIVGLGLPPAMAHEICREAAGRGVSLRKLFEEIWSLYRAKHPETLS